MKSKSKRIRSANQPDRKLRVQLDLHPDMVTLLDSAAVAIGGSTRAEVVRRAISLYAILIKRVKEGCEIHVIHPGSTDRERVLFI
jgi:hypothetical protein